MTQGPPKVKIMTQNIEIILEMPFIYQGMYVCERPHAHTQYTYIGRQQGDGHPYGRVVQCMCALKTTLPQSKVLRLVSGNGSLRGHHWYRGTIKRGVSHAFCA